MELKQFMRQEQLWFDEIDIYKDYSADLEDMDQLFEQNVESEYYGCLFNRIDTIFIEINQIDLEAIQKIRLRQQD